jgi:hypothetical protein
MSYDKNLRYIHSPIQIPLYALTVFLSPLWKTHAAFAQIRFSSLEPFKMGRVQRMHRKLYPNLMLVLFIAKFPWYKKTGSFP